MRTIRCKRCLNICQVKVTLKGTVSSCCEKSVFTQDEPLPKNKYLKPWWQRKMVEDAARKEIEK